MPTAGGTNISRGARLALLAALGALALSSAHADLLIRNVNILTMDDPGFVENHAVVVEGGRIASLVPDAAVAPDFDGTVVDARGGFLTPGLIDAHVHHREHVEYANYVAHGVTTVLGLGQGDSLDAMLNVKAAIDGGTLLGPDVYTTGGAIANHVWIDDPGEARDYVRRLAADGRPFVKIYNEIPQDVFDAVAGEAAAQGIAVFGHIPRNFPAAYSIANGLDVVAHAEEFYFTYFDGPRDSELDAFDGSQIPDAGESAAILDLMVEHDVALIPNLVFTFDQMRFWRDERTVLADPETAYLHPALRADWMRRNATQRDNVLKRMLRERVKYNLIHEFTRRARDAGVLLVTGTDAPLPGLFPGKSLHAEMRELVKSGLTYEEALAAATRNGGELVAKYVDADARVGRIAPGYEADLVLVSDDPRADIRHMSAIAGVVVDGRWLSDTELERIRSKIATGYRRGNGGSSASGH